MVWEDLRPSKIMTREAFENVIVVNSAIGGSTNAPIHFNAIARHIGVELDNDDWEKIGYDIPLLVNLQPAGEYLGEEYHRAGGVPAVVNELLKAGKIRKNTLTVNGKTLAANCKNTPVQDDKVIRPYGKPMKDKAGFLNLKGNLFESAIMKTSVISPQFRERYLSNPKDPNAFEGRAIVFDGPEDYHHRIDDPALKIDETCLLFVRGTGPRGYPGGAEVVNMQPPASLIKRGVTELPCIGDGRQSGTSGSPSILNASPEAANCRRSRRPANGRSCAHRLEQAHGRHFDQQRRVRKAPDGARSERRLSDSRASDAVAGNSARHGRRAFQRHGA